jgi:ABC-type molybdenum transport system ATPase subunit/photorepair protein PhrA
LKANAIELSDVGVVRDRCAILAGVRLTVPKGGCCAVLGPNGSGKSALVAVLSGYLWPLTGTVRVNGATYAQVDLA